MKTVHLSTIHLRAQFLGLFSILVLLCPVAGLAGGVYQEPDAFIAEIFSGSPPKASVLWLDKELKQDIAIILAHPYKGLRVRYWRDKDTEGHERTAWVLEEIGKEKPITVGIVVRDGRIQQVKILVFRESRGWEVRHGFFTDQFSDAGLIEDHRLDTTVDNISGATLSVRAVTKLARIALLLDARIKAPDPQSGKSQ